MGRTCCRARGATANRVFLGPPTAWLSFETLPLHMYLYPHHRTLYDIRISFYITAWSTVWLIAPPSLRRQSADIAREPLHAHLLPQHSFWIEYVQHPRYLNPRMLQHVSQGCYNFWSAGQKRCLFVPLFYSFPTTDPQHTCSTCLRVISGQ